MKSIFVKEIQKIIDLGLVYSGNEILTKPCISFDFKNSPFDPVDFAQTIVKMMYDNSGIGLAANQIGVPFRIFAMRGAPENFVCFNPRIVELGEEQILLEESCLSYPGLAVKIKRPRHVRVRFTRPDGETQTNTFTGLTARVFLHELEHLDGEIFYRGANLYHREQALKNWEKFKKKNQIKMKSPDIGKIEIVGSQVLPVVPSQVNPVLVFNTEDSL